jgi:hypothetical protein
MIAFFRYISLWTAVLVVFVHLGNASTLRGGASRSWSSESESSAQSLLNTTSSISTSRDLQNTYTLLPTEKTILECLYTATDGPHWYSTWDLTTDPCQNYWHGVSCTCLYTATYCNVLSLTSSYNQLQGTIPTCLTGLSLLDTLDLSANALVSSIPSR